MYKQAAQLKLRFNTAKGQLTTEDLWSLPLTSKSNVSLDGIAIAVNKQLQESKDNSFVTAKSTGNTTLELQLDILKDIIATRLEQNENNRAALARKQQKDKIAEIITSKQDEALLDMSIEDLEKMLEE